MTTDQTHAGVLFNLQQQMGKLVRQRNRVRTQERLIAVKKKAIEDDLARLDRELSDLTN